MRRFAPLLGLAAILAACSSGVPKGAEPPQPSERKALNDAAAMLIDSRAQKPATAQDGPAEDSQNKERQ